MKRAYAYITTTFATEVKGFMVDVVVRTNDNIAELWLYHKDYGIKTMMFGVSINASAEIESLVDSSLMDYIKTYRKQYMEGVNI